MIAKYAARILLPAMMIGLFGTGVAEAQDSPNDLAAAIKEVKQAEADYNKKKGAEHDAMVSDKAVYIHSSGWIYNKQEHAEQSKNSAVMVRRARTLMSTVSDERIVAYSRDAVLTTRMTTNYFEVPDPQEEARKAGTMTDDPAANARAANVRGFVPPPGETAERQNPQRERTANLWLRINGHWQLAGSFGARVNLKTHP